MDEEPGPRRAPWSARSVPIAALLLAFAGCASPAPRAAGVRAAATRAQGDGPPAQEPGSDAAPEASEPRAGDDGDARDVPPAAGEDAAQVADEDGADDEAATAASGDEPAPASGSDDGGLLARTDRLVDGTLSLRYRGRAAGSDHDHDLRGFLSLDVADPDTTWIRGHVQARADLDLDGHDDDSVFQDLSDTWDSSLTAKLYLAWAEIDLGPDGDGSQGTLRLGRQSDPRLPEVLRMDGVAWTSRPYGGKDVVVGVYGGIPAHLYESSPEGDRSFGAWIEGLPWSGGRTRFDWMHLEDEELLGEENDDLFSLALWQDVGRAWRLEGEHTRIESDARDLRLRALYRAPEGGTQVRVAYYELLETQRRRVQELDPFYDALLDYFPFRQGSVSVSQELGSHAVLDVGYDVRRVDDAGDVGEFNRDWERYYATATLLDVVADGLSVSLTGDRWNDDQRDIGSLGADVSYDQETWRGSLGTYFALYKYELLELDEREDVRTYYVRGTRELDENLRLELGYELEDDDFETYHILRGGLLWRF